MLRAEESTRSGPETDRKDEVNTQQETRAEEGAGRLIARCGIQAVNAAERAICGAGAVHRATTAEGLALAGRRAATLLEDVPSAEPPGAAATTAPWIHHRLRPGQPGFGGCMAFELVASSAQEAVDQCMVAHWLAARLGRPGLCTADRIAIAGPQLVRLPESTTIGSLLDHLEPPIDPPRPSSAEIVAAAEEAFRRVSESTGRRSGLLALHRMNGAEVALVASGASCRRSVEIADALREAGIACGVVSVNLVRPFPTEALRSVLQDVSHVAVVLPPGSSLERDQLISRVGGAWGEPNEPRGLALDGEPGLPAALAETLGLSADQRTAAETALLSQREEDRSVVLGAAPAGCWSEQFLLDAAARIGSLGHLNLHCPESSPTAASTLALGRKTPDESASRTIDLLFLPEAALLGRARSLLDALKKDGTLVLAAAGPSQAVTLDLLGQPMLRELTDRGVHLKWVDAADINERSDTPEAARTRLLGAFLAAGQPVASIVGQSDLVAALGKTGTDEELLRDGAAALRDLDTEAPAPEADLRPGRSLPLMPDVPERETSDPWRTALHEFHLSGRGAWSRTEPLPSLPLRPAGLSVLGSPEWLWKFYPFVLMPDGTTRAFSSLVTEIVDSAESAGKPMDVVAHHWARLARIVSRVIRTRPDGTAFGEIVDEATRVFAGGFELSESAAAELDAELDRFKNALPESAELVDIDERTLLRFLTEALGRERGSRRYNFLEEVKALAVRLRELLQIDDALTPEGSSPEAIEASVGGGIGVRIDAAAMSRLLPAQRGSKRLPERRRQRIERTLATLKSYVEQAAGEPECILVHPGLLSDETPLPAARMVVHPEALEAAVGLFDGVANRMTDVIRAVRVARLEQRSGYDAERHDPVMDRFDWQAFTQEELLLIPAVVVVETGERLRGNALSAFSSVLRSGRPVQVLVIDETRGVEAGETFEALAGYHPGLGYLAVAHREALVIQGTLAHPAELVQGLGRMASAVVPAVTLVSVPSWTAPAHPWLQLAAMHFGRGAPLFRYDPNTGTTWAERFDLSENPQPEMMWTLPEVSCVDGSGTERLLGEPFTFAHAAALDPVFRPHFRVVPPEGWSDDQLLVSEYLAVSDEQRLRYLPYIWVVDNEGVLARAVMTRELAFACRDHMRAWRILQELGGANNEYARRAAERARENAAAEAETARTEMETAHAEALDVVRRTAAGEAMERLAAVLTSEDALAAMAGASTGAAAVPGPSTAPPPAAAPAEPATAPAAPVEEEEEEEEAVAFSDPYIDSMLCTTCNECTNLNGRMFQYNENRQAFVADAAAGTFAELVKAAEKCPARCIHPGAPRDGDDTVTDDLIARAAKFN
jgi:ferredoxin